MPMQADIFQSPRPVVTSKISDFFFFRSFQNTQQHKIPLWQKALNRSALMRIYLLSRKEIWSQNG
jgi:hypothetical protein